MDVIFVALYDLNSREAEVLSFKNKDRFIPLPNVTNDPNWSCGVDFQGKVGLVPTSYVRSEAIAKDELVYLIEVILSELERKCCGVYNRLQRYAIQELTTKRTLLLSPIHSPEEKCEQVSQKTVQTPKSLNIVNSKTETKNLNAQVPSPFAEVQTNHFDHAIENHINHVKAKSDDDIVSNNTEPIKQSIHKADSIDVEVQCSELQNNECSNNADGLDVSKINVPVLLIPSLIENVRHETQLSHQNSKIAVAVVLDTLSEALPDLHNLWDQLKNNLNKFEVIQEEVENVIDSEDRRKLRDIFKQLWYCKNDEQQRSWPVHEDEQLISSLLENLNTILMDADPRMSKETVQHDDYEMVNLLVTYYQMEPRRVLRIKMLHVFITLCELDIVVVSQLLTSVLPMELARDMQCTFDDTEKLQFSAFLLTIIFSTGQKPPNAIHEFINREFFLFLLENFEETMRDGIEDVSNHLLNIILAFNLHFQDDQNIIFQTLKEREYARMLTEKLVLLINREEDPVKILNNTPETPNSVLKFMVDFFANAELIQLFYLNDIKVLLDIIIRQLTDYIPGEPKRLWYLRLVRNLLKNLKHEVDSHHQESLEKCFRTVLNQEIPCVEEIELVHQIIELCPLFSSFQKK